MSGALDVDVECCRRCKKLEFYLLGDAEEPETGGIRPTSIAPIAATCTTWMTPSARIAASA